MMDFRCKGISKRVKVKRLTLWLLFIMALLLSMFGCTGQHTETVRPLEAAERQSDVYYQIFIRSFYDSDGDGIGDINGIIEKLDYLNDGNPDTDTDLGVDGIWLLPFHPSPSYHGYDVTDYYAIHPDYGTMDDFRRLIEKARKRGLKIIMDLVVNHTSSEHPWFKDAAASTDSEYRNWYVWADEHTNTAEAGAVGGPAWHKSETGHYLGIFWSGMPDLNFDHPPVRQEMIRIGQFWLEQGVHGFRIDAAKHIYEDWAHSKNDPEVRDKNIAWWNEFRSAMEEVHPDVYIVGEVWDSSPVVIAPYLEPFDSAFNFGLASDIIANTRSERSGDYGNRLRRIHDLYREASSGSFIDAPFLTNHDQNRVMSELKGNMEHAKMAAAQLLTLPGNPFIYYGEEIGMEGQKPDEHIREPMIWYEDHTRPGMTRWIQPKHNQGTALSVETQTDDPDSLLSHYRRLIRWRTEIPALDGGEINDYRSNNRHITAYVRTAHHDRVLVLHNMSSVRQQMKWADDSDSSFRHLVASTKEGVEISKQTITLPPYSTVILR